MNTRQLNRIFARALYGVVIAAMVFSMTGTVHAAGARTFVGIWRAIDNFDGSLIRVTITGLARGPFLISWTESYFSFCDGQAGIAVGKGRLDPADPYVLEADMRLTCLRTGDTTEWHQVWRYKPDYDVLASYGDYRVETIWTRLGQALVPRMDLRVNYGQEWVESFYAAGHTVLVTVTETDGVTVKATIEVQTEPKDYWGAQSGFQSLDGVWDPGTPDIQPDDWVFAQADNGQTAQVQIGKISGKIGLQTDSISGTILADWFADPVQVECLDWGSGGGPFNKDGGLHETDGSDSYSCAWDPETEWDIQPWQTVGVGYLGADGHWVANAFDAPNPRIVASESGDWFWMTEFYPGVLDLFIYESADENATLLWSGSLEAADLWGITSAGYDVHGQNLIEGNYVVVSDGVNAKGIVLRPISVTIFDTINNVMAGFAPAGSEVWAAAGPMEWQARIMVVADSESGWWSADFKTYVPDDPNLPLGFDITEDMRPWSYAHIYDQDGDANEGNTPPPHPVSVIFAHPAYELIEGSNWLPGTEVTLQVDDPANGEGADYSDNQIVGDDTWLHFWLSGFDLQAGHLITMTDSQYSQTMVVSNLRVTGFDLDARTVSGVGDPGSEFFIADNGITVPVDGERNWSVSFDELLPGTWWTIIQAYPDGNEIRETFRVPEPQISAHPAYNFIEGHEWTPGGLVTVMIDDPANGEGVDYTQDATASDNINYLYDTRVQFPLAYDLKAGDKVTMTDGQYTQTMIVSSLKVTGFNLDAQTVYGVGDPGSEVLVADNETLVDENGNWSAFIDGLLPGSWWGVAHTYPDGNQTVETFRAPAPAFYVTPEENEVFAAEWTPGQTLEVYVNGEPTDSQTVPDDGSYYGPEVHFFLKVDVKAGDTITLTDGRWTKELIVARLQVTGFDLTSPITISGIADPGSLFIGVNGEDRLITVGEEETWEVSSTEYESGEWGSVIITDSDGDQTRDIFMIPYP